MFARPYMKYQTNVAPKGSDTKRKINETVTVCVASDLSPIFFVVVKSNNRS